MTPILLKYLKKPLQRKKLQKNSSLKIDDLKKNPNDRIRILGDAGISIVGAGLGAAAASTVAGALGVTSIAGVTSVASWVGITAVSATPIGWVIGAAAVGAGAAYGVSRIIHGGGLSEGRKSELLQQYKQEIRNMEAKENAESITQEDKDAFVFSLKELIAKDAIDPNEAKALIEYVENGIIPVSEAFKTVYALLDEAKKDSFLDNTKEITKDTQKKLSKSQSKKIEDLRIAREAGFISDVDYEQRVQNILS